MGAAQPIVPAIDVQGEVRELRQQLLPFFQVLMLLELIAWYCYVISASVERWKVFWPLLLALVGILGVTRLRERSYELACWLLLADLLVVNSLLLAVSISPLAIVFGLAVMLAANALLGAPQALLAALLTLGTNALTLRLVADHPLAATPLADMGVLYLLTWMILWVSARPAQGMVQSTLEGWAQARKALLELRDRRGELYRVVRALEEATARIERINNQLIVARHEAESARAIKAHLTATVSHELRGPLNLILGFSELMALSPESYPQPLPEAYRADVFTIYRNSQHLLTLINDVLDLSKIDAQRLPLTKDQVNLNEDVIRKVTDSVQPLANRRQLYLRQDLARDLPTVTADPVRLRQALLNLLTNAIRFTQNGGVTISTTPNQGHILVSVRDTGTGIPEDELPNLFKEFHQLQQASDLADDGTTGLGLSIAKHLIELHGGRIWVESKRGVGTTFYFTVPAALSEAAQTVVKTAPLSAHRHTSLDCVVLHEDPRVASLIDRYLEGAQVVGVSGERELLHVVERLHPRAIVADPERVQPVRQTLAAAGHDVPIVSCVMPHLEQEFVSQGVLRYLVKPVAPDLLLEAVSAVEREGETTILLVDDEPDTVRLLERMLLNLPRPYRLLKAYDGLQALQIMEETLPDVVIMDLLMPRLDGLNTIARMRAAERTQAVPVVIVSAYDWLEECAVFQMPMSLHADQPVNIATGARCIQTLMGLIGPHYVNAADSP